jgi:hypothetical protein
LRVQRKENLPDQRSVAGRVNRNRCPHARARARRAPIPAPADIIIIDRPSSIVAPNQNLRTNPLKRNGDVDQRALTQSDLLEPPGRRCGRRRRDLRGHRQQIGKSAALTVPR